MMRFAPALKGGAASSRADTDSYWRLTRRL